MAKDKKYPEKFEDSFCNSDGNCRDCVDNDICDVPDDDYGDFVTDVEDDWRDWQDWEDFDYDDMQGYV